MMSKKKKHTLLLIDDKPANLISLKACLKTKTVKLLRLSASEGLQYIKRKISLILVDVQMPEMDGYEFVVDKQHPNTSNIPTIFVTAISDEPKHVNKAYDLAIDFYSSR
jgi:response regulator RpfG family c-di-GMP phosphodiesterase